jgi:hypothetical protein
VKDTKLGGRAMFGVAIAPHRSGLDLVNDANQTLQLLQ